MLARFLKDESGATAIEYGLIIAILSLAIVSGLGSLADVFAEMFQFFADALRQQNDNDPAK
jgi:pilus assembly protein Flp/PilA